MMEKKKLERLRRLDATPAMVRALAEPGRERNWYCSGASRYRYHLAARCQQLAGYLKVSICTREDIGGGIRTPRWDIFINYEGDEYITRERQEDGSYKWRTAYIYNLEDGYRYRGDYDQYLYINREGDAAIRRLLGTEEGGYRGIARWQEGCRKRREDERIKRLTDRWDREMVLVKDPPGGFEEWWHHNAFDGADHLFYGGADAEEGFCTSCQKMVPLPGRPRHNAAARCPVCRRPVTLISRKKKTTDLWTSGRDVSCVQRYGEGLVHRYFWVRRCDKKDPREVNRSVFTVRETRRTLILGDVYRVYEYGDYRQRGARWYERTDCPIERHGEKLYTRNLKRLLGNSRTSYLIAAGHADRSCGLAYFLAMEKRYPVIEMAFKAGLHELGKEMLDRNWRIEKMTHPGKGGLARILGIDGARMKRLRQMGGGLGALAWLQEEKRRDTIFRDGDIMTLCEADLEPPDLDRAEITRYLSLEKICNYLNQQAGYKKGARGYALAAVWRDWNDYLRMMQEMKMDCSRELLLKPKNLMITHNQLVAAISMQDSGKEIGEKEKRYRTAQEMMEQGGLKRYEYSDGRFCIMAPEGIRDIYREGITLKHCIHTCDIYFQRIDIGESFLLFLRRAGEPDTPWYTLEVEPGGNIRQKRSVLNEAYSDLDDALPFLQEWQQWVKAHLSEEEKKLAERSDRARRDGYRKLREEKKIVWHGSLQGTLLADALEGDFMEA